MEEIRIESKYDYELSKGEVKKIFSVYNECFDDGRCVSSKLLKKAYALIGSSHIWRWYLAYSGHDLIGIAAYVYDPVRIAKMVLEGGLDVVQVNVLAGENVCNVGVKSRFRRRGVARCLMEEIIDDYQPSGVEKGNIGKDLVVEVMKGSEHYLGIMQLYTDLDFSELDDGKYDNDQVRYLVRPQIDHHFKDISNDKNNEAI